MISIIVRFKNEARYLGAVLQAIRAQRTRETIEIVAVDNLSDDGSRQVAEEYADLLCNIDDYRPGAALNKAIDACSGSVIAVLSAHAIPANDSWLENLCSWLPNSAVLGTYGGQLYPITSRFLDKRDLDIFSDLRPRTEAHDSDFWNANSVFHRASWAKLQFDEGTYELEDHYWTKQHLSQGGQWVRFEPSALVYHYGHETRNDRTFLPHSRLSDEQRIQAAVAALTQDNGSWPTVMCAGLLLSSLASLPATVEAIPALGHALSTHSDFDVRWRMAGALGRITNEKSASYLVRALTDPSFYARDEAAWSLGRLGSLAAPHLARLVGTIEMRFQPFVALAMGLTGDLTSGATAVDVLRGCLTQGDQGIARDALYFLGEIADVPEAASLGPMVSRYLTDDADELVRAAVWCWGALVTHHEESALPYIGAIVDLARHHPVETVRYEAVVALGKTMAIQPRAGLTGHLRQGLRDDGAGRVRYGALQSLRLLASRGMDIDVPYEHDTDPDFGVRFEQHLLHRQLNGEHEQKPP